MLNDMFLRNQTHSMNCLRPVGFCTRQAVKRMHQLRRGQNACAYNSPPIGAVHNIHYDRLKSLYTRAMQLEVNFFSAQPNCPPPRNIGLLVVDFDETCTQQDTISTLLAAAVEANVKASAPAAADALRQQLTTQIKTLADNYVTKQQQLLQQILPDTPPGCVSNLSYNKSGLLAFCDALSDFDVKMNQVVIDAGCLKGLTRDDVIAAAAGVKLRPDCGKTLTAAAAANIPVAVLSVNWSKTMLQTVLQPAAAAAAAANGTTEQQQQQFECHSNELVFDDQGLSTGHLQREIQNGRDKGLVMDQLLQRYAGSSSSSSSGAVVYVGDSASDILPLLKADYGIIIGSNKQLRKALAAFGVKLQPLCGAPLTPSSSSSSSDNTATAAAAAPVLYEASSWAEIAAFIFGPDWYDTTAAAAASSNGVAAAAAEQNDGSGVVRMQSGHGAAVVAAAAAAAAAAGSAAAALGLSPPPVLTIAGSDSGGGAGIQADLKTIMANGGFGMSVLTALTAQNSTGVQAVHIVPKPFLEQQIDSVFTDLKPAAVKTGMLPDAAAVELVARKLKQYGAGSSSSSRNGLGFRSAAAAAGGGKPLLPVVVDPVMISTSGHALAEGSVAAAMQQQLLPLATIVTPNLAEAQTLLGDNRPISSLEDMQAAAVALHKRCGCANVLIKGGHLAEQQQQQQAADSDIIQSVDVLYDGDRCYYFTAPYIKTRNTHGTGCTLAAAIATALANGSTAVQAVQIAKDYLTRVLAASVGLGLGTGPQHPFNHGAGFSSTRVLDGGSVGLLNPKTLESPVKHRLNPVDLRVYVVTDSGCNKKTGRSLLQAVQGAVAGGATVVQLREKDIDGGCFIEEARAVIRLCRPLGIPVIINDRVDVALASGADGVHVGQSDIPARLVRQMIGPDKILGVSVKTPAEAAKAQADGADYIGVGAVFPTGTKDSSVIGLDGVADLCRRGSLPAVAIGGVGVANAAATIATGVKGLAVVSAVFAADDVEAATRQLREAVDAALQQQQQQAGRQPAAAVVE